MRNTLKVAEGGHHRRSWKPSSQWRTFVHGLPSHVSTHAPAVLRNFPFALVYIDGVLEGTPPPSAKTGEGIVEVHFRNVWVVLSALQKHMLFCSGFQNASVPRNLFLRTSVARAEGKVLSFRQYIISTSPAQPRKFQRLTSIPLKVL